jgi:curved DNA-binding protein CbpA
MKTLYQQLGITPQASQTVVQQSFFRLAKKLDPKNPLNQSNERARAEYLAVQSAYRTLSNLESRANYDRSLQIQSLKPNPDKSRSAAGEYRSR